MEFERRTLLVQFISVQPLSFYSTADGTDLVQDILRSQFSRAEKDLLGQEGSISLDDQGEFLSFEPTDTKNRTLHLPIEHLAYAGALRRMRRDSSDQRNPDQILRRDFENVDLANRYAQHIIGPPIFVGVFHGFDKALCYTFVTQSADDACLLVMKLMRAFKSLEEKLDEQGREREEEQRQGLPSPVSPHQALFVNAADQGGASHAASPFLHSPYPSSSSNSMFRSNAPHDDLLQQLLHSNPNLQVVQQPYQPSFVRQEQQQQQPPPVSSPHFADVHPTGLIQQPSCSPMFIQRNPTQDINYQQKVIVRWLKPPTPPPPAPIIIREIQAPPQRPPPIICRQVAPCPPTPPPIIVREPPPACQPAGQPVIVERRLPGACLPRQVIVERCPAPPAKPPTVIYEKYLPQPLRPRQVIVQREQCVQPAAVATCAPSCVPTRRLVKEIIRHVPQPAPAVVCRTEQQQQISPGQSHAVEQLVPVFATRQHVVQPKGIRVIRQVIGPAQGSIYPTAVH